MLKIKQNISNKILSIGPNYINYKGGIGAIIYLYSLYFYKFNAIITLKDDNIINRIIIFFIAIIRFFYKMIFNNKIAIIHIHSSSGMSFFRKFCFFFLGKYVFRKKIIYHIHSGRFDSFYENSNYIVKKMIQLTMSKSDSIVSVSKSWEKYFKNKFNPRRSITIPNIIDYPKDINVYKLDDKINILYLGLIAEAKGIFDLMELIRVNKNKYNNRVKFRIGGLGKTEELLQIIKDNNLSNIVEYIGWVDGENKIKELIKSDIFILPSYSEGLPISILEAMSYRNAIIASDVGGIPEIVFDKSNGILIKPGAINELENAIDYLINSPYIIQEYAEESVKLVEKHLPINVLHSLNTLYEELLQHEKK